MPTPSTESPEKRQGVSQTVVLHFGSRSRQRKEQNKKKIFEIQIKGDLLEDRNLYYKITLISWFNECGNQIFKN